MKRVGLVRSHISRRQGSRPAAPVEAASQAPNPAVFDDGKQGLVERTLNAAGKWYYQNIQPFNFAQHHEGQTGNRLDHTSVSMEANCTAAPQKLIQDKNAKFFTVEGLPGAGKADFTSGIAAGAGLKDMGKGDLMWELTRLRDFKGENNLYNTWKMLIEEGHHYLAMRSVDMQKFYENPKDHVHSCRMQDHMKLQRHIHTMDCLYHLLTTAQGTITNRTYHSDYCYAYAMMKMGYLSKNYYEMRYTVSHAAIDGSGTATDLTPHVSFFLDISPEEALEKIKARGNEAEIKTITLDFLKHLDEAYRGFWAEDMHNKGCTVMNIDPSRNTHSDIVDLLDERDDDELRHPYCRWNYLDEKQLPGNNMSAYFGPGNAWITNFLEDYESMRSPRSEIPFIGRFFFQGGNHYEQVLIRDLSKGPHFSYELNHSFQPWDELSESSSYRTNLSWINTYNIMHALADQGKKSPEETRAECGPIKYHPAWRPKDADWFDQGHTDTSRILFGSYKPFVGTEHVQNRSMLFGL